MATVPEIKTGKEEDTGTDGEKCCVGWMAGGRKASAKSRTHNGNRTWCRHDFRYKYVEYIFEAWEMHSRAITN